MRPSLLREECEMLDEVHWLMSVRNLRFILCGSNARKLRRCGANLLGGRVIRKVHAQKRLEAYVGDYLQQEIVAEAV